MLTDKEKIIFNKGLDIYKEEKTKSLDIANKRIEKELNISIKEYNEIQNYVINLIKEHEKYDSLMYISLLIWLTMFAIQKYMPSPFYAFDEVDMHLDGPNVERLATIITNQSKTAQFVVVSLRKPMLDNADRMIGVTQKDKGVTKISGVKLKDE